jgi:hypothetical protein
VTRRFAIVALFLSIVAIAVAYASAFRKTGTPGWSPWVVAVAVPVTIVAIMILGAARDEGIGRLKIPFAFVALNLIVGFVAALALPGTESAASKLFLGLPLRAAIVIYGVGLLPIFILPVAYALTFETQTLSAADVERVRRLGQAKPGGERRVGDSHADGDA